MADQSPNMAPPPNSSTANSNTSSSMPPKSSPSPPLSPPPPPLSPPPPQNSPPPSNSTNENNTQNGKGSSFISPPAPPHDKLPSSFPPPSSPHNSGSRENSTGSDLSSDVQYLTISIPVIAGVAGAIVLLIIIVGIVSCISKKRRKRKPHHHMQYYADSSGLKVTDSAYYIGAQTQTNQITTDDIWHPSPPPPPPPMTSEDMTSSVPHEPPLPPPSPIMVLGFNKCMFTYEELSAATNGFVQSNLLGQGGFGYVHKGVLPNGKEIAVKSLKSGSGQGEREFQAEVDIISRVHHRHLVSLVGYCCSGSARLLVYDFVPNKTLDYHLHGKGVPTMDWPTRLKIALGSAKGLAYLHEDCHPRIIHRDIKSSNILLDFNFEAMVADFGLAKLSSDKDTHVSTRVMGTFGYLAPEYASSGKLTEKSDVFSFGVMLLEIITGKRPTDSSHTFMEDSLVDWARPVLSQALTDGNYDEIADPNLNGNYDPTEMARMVACAAASVRHSARRRPKTSQIVRALEGDVSLEDLNEGIRPGQSIFSSSGSEYDSDNVYSHHSNTRMNNNRPKKATIMDGPDRLSSDEFSDPTIEYAGHGLGARRSSSSDFAFSDELSPVGNQRLRAPPSPPPL